MGIETSIVVPGAFAKGTNHFAHAEQPKDAAIVEQYYPGTYRGFDETVKTAFAGIVHGCRCFYCDKCDGKDCGRTTGETLISGRCGCTRRWFMVVNPISTAFDRRCCRGSDSATCSR